MHCPTCNAANPDANRFCESCGAAFTQPCPACGYACSASAKYCGGCGVPLAWRDGTLVAKAQTVPAAEAWGELKQATVLFADVVGSTEMVAGLDPEQAMERLRPVLYSLCEAVERFGGTVIRTLGDGVMALFGVPKTLEGHPLLACQAALAMVQASLQAPHGLQIRIGLHSGQVASDPHDAKGGRGGGAHGLTIHLASRVVALAQPGGICLTGATKSLLGYSCQLKRMGEYPLKGITGLTAIYQLLSLSATGMTPDTDSSERWVSPFRGRQLELDILQAALARAQAGDARVLGISAEPGGGKSRLCQEFVQRCRAQGLPVVEVRAQLYGHATPLQPILELLRSGYFHIAASDSPDIARTRIAQRLQSLQASAEDTALVDEFLGVAAPDAPPSSLSPRAKHQRMLELLRQLVRQAGGQPSVILFEDLHWLDEASEGFVAALVDAVAATHTLVVMNYRPHYRPSWAQSAHFTQLDLPDLSAADMQRMVAELLGERAELAEVCQLVVQRSAGNPFFAEELARTLIDSELLLDLEGGMPPGRLEQIEHALPATVQAVIGAKVDALGEPEKTLLQMCAIIGKEIPMAVIEQVASHLRQVLEQGLAGLREAGLILQQSNAGDRQFVFRHPIIQEVTYSMQLKVRRVVLHGTVAQVMETYYRDRPDEFAGLIAYHYEAADDRLSAAEYTARAARWIGTTNSAQAVKSWRKVRWLLDGFAAAPEVNRLRVMAGGQLGVLGWREGLTLQEIGPIVDEALALADVAEAPVVQLLLVAQGRMLAGAGASADQYVALAEKALSLVAVEDLGRKATIYALLSQAFGWAGRLREALRANDCAMQSAHLIDSFDQGFVGFDIGHWIVGIRSRMLVRLGRFDLASASLDRFVKFVESSHDPVLRQVAHIFHVELAWYIGAADEAESHAIASAAIAETYQAPYLRVFALLCLARSSMLGRHFAVAREQLIAALELVRVVPVALDQEAEFVALLAECYVGTGDIGMAVTTARCAVALARERSHRFAECHALIVESLALSLLDSRAEEFLCATMLMEKASRLMDDTGAECLRPLLNKAHASWAQDSASQVVEVARVAGVSTND